MTKGVLISCHKLLWILLPLLGIILVPSKDKNRLPFTGTSKKHLLLMEY